jgi:NAD(P)-dependent dehydrogenase (short-subunit alcohol dehydrogenase family)
MSTPPADLSGAVALVTGASRGIGRAVALELAARGARVVVSGRTAARAEAVVAEIAERGGEAVAHVADVRQAEQVERLVARTLERFGRLDCAFNNAGVEGVIGELAEQRAADFDEVMAVNARGVWLCMRHEIPVLRAGGGGTIVNAASVLAARGRSGLSAYCASKHAVLGMTRCAALECAADGIRVNAVAPGNIETDMLRRVMGEDPSVRGELERAIPQGRIGTAAEVAAGVAFLCGAGGSYITGELLTIDGGIVAR